MTVELWSRRVLWATALLLVSCASYISGRAESTLLEAMPRVLGPADRYEATVEGANADASHFARVRVSGVRLQRPRAPVIDRFEADLRDVSIDRPNKLVTSIGAAQAEIRVTAADLAAYLERQNWIAQPQVLLSPPDGVTVSGLLRVPGLSATPTSSAMLRGRLVPSGSQLLVEIDALSLGDRRASPFLRSVVGTAVNPLFDLSAYAVPSNIDRVSAQDDAIRLEASGSRIQVNRPK